jgi:S-adenosylmethionine/arginine decarboxylase-like enzyme
MVPSVRESVSSSHAHLVAEFHDVPEELLGDASRLGGVLVAAAGAAGLHTLGAPMVRTRAPHGVDAMLLLEGGHAALHTHPERSVILVDLLAPVRFDLVRAFDVLSRRLLPGEVRAERLLRGA